MKKVAAVGLLFLVLSLTGWVAYTGLFPTDPARLMADAAQKVNEAKSAHIKAEAIIGGHAPERINADAFFAFPRSFRLEERTTSKSESRSSAELLTGQRLYLRDATEGKWVSLTGQDSGWLRGREANSGYLRLADLIGSVSNIIDFSRGDGIQTFKARVNWPTYVAAAKKGGFADLLCEKLPPDSQANLVLVVDERSGYVKKSELKAVGRGASLSLRCVYSGWDKDPAAVIPPAASETISKEEADLILKAKKHFDSGTRSYLAEDYAGAASEFSLAALQQPDKYQYSLWLAKAYLKKRAYDKAESFAEKAIALDGQRADGYSLASRVLAIDDQGKPERRTRAIEYAQKAVMLDPDSSESYTALGMAYWLKSMPTLKEAPAAIAASSEETLTPSPGYLQNRAMVALEKAIELDPNAPEPEFLKGLMLVSAADILGSAPQGQADLLDIGLKEADKLERAGESFSRVQTLDPGYIEDLLSFSVKGFAVNAKDASLAKKFADLKDQTEQLNFDGARWQELKGSSARTALEKWFAAYRDFLSDLFDLSGTKPPVSYYSTLDAIDQMLKAVYVTI